MSVIMSDMKAKRIAKKAPARRVKKTDVVEDTFTVRELGRHTQMVLKAAKKLGSVVVSSRSGEEFTLQPRQVGGARAASRGDLLDRLSELHARMSAEGYTGFTKEGWETFSRTIAGE